MPKLKDLQEKREKLVVDARSALEEITKNTDESRSKELEERHDKIMGEFDQVDAQIVRSERQAKIEQDADERRARQRPNPGDGEVNGADNDQPITYRSAFHRYVQVAGDHSALSDEERAALRAGVAPKEARAQSVGTATAGGYTVPTELSAEIIKSMAAWGPMLDDGFCTIMNTSSGHPIDLPTVDDTATEVAKHTENGAVTDDGGSDVVFGKKTLSAHAYDTEWVKFSWELAQDSVFNFETLLGGLLGERLGRRGNKELTIGDGVGDPQGIVVGSSLGKTATAVAAITYDELIDLVHSVDPAYRSSPKAGFQMHDQTLAAVRKLKDTEGRYIWSAGDVQKGVPATILGYSFRVNQAMAQLAAASKIMIFGDHSKYYVRKVGGVVMFVARERFAPDIGLLGLVRVDGRLADAAAVKHLITAAA